LIEQFVIKIGQDALLTVLMVAAPMLGLGMVVGLLVSIFQATTQINEQTLTFVPKIVAVMAAIFLFGPWMLTTLVEFTARLYQNLHTFVGL